ncbi:MAG: hypothetical protein AAGF23_22920 [Acidobacteriota bacterium]
MSDAAPTDPSPRPCRTRPGLARRYAAAFAAAALVSAAGCAPPTPETRPGAGEKRSASITGPISDASATSFPQDTTTVDNIPGTLLAIAEIQGAGHASPFTGRHVRTEGAVTGVGAGFFFIESLEPDADDATSEGLRVVTAEFGEGDGGDEENGPAKPSVERGQHVRILGRVEELRGRDRDLTVTSLRLSGRDGDLEAGVEIVGRAELPPPVRLLGDGRMIPKRVADDDRLERFEPENDGVDFFESLEGMRVRVEAPLVTGGTGRRGGLFMMAEKGAGDPALHPRGGLLRREGDAKPDALYLDAGLGVAPPTVDVGQGLDPVTAVVDYERGGYRLRLLDPTAGRGQGPPPA